MKPPDDKIPEEMHNRITGKHMLEAVLTTIISKGSNHLVDHLT